jgi:hypothetical protein
MRPSSVPIDSSGHRSGIRKALSSHCIDIHELPNIARFISRCTQASSQFGSNHAQGLIQEYPLPSGLSPIASRTRRIESVRHSFLHSSGLRKPSAYSSIRAAMPAAMGVAHEVPLIICWPSSLSRCGGHAEVTHSPSTMIRMLSDGAGVNAEGLP